MQTVKNTIAENLGKFIPANSLAPEDGKFSLNEVPDLSGKTALVTGGTEGIGYACVHTLLDHNITKVYILSPNKDRADGAIASLETDLGADKTQRIEWLQCDLSDWEKVGPLALDLAHKLDRLDILINNAGRGIMSFEQDKHGIDMNMSINHFGHVILTSHLIPVLKKTAEQGTTVRIVNMASNAHMNAPNDPHQFDNAEELSKDLGRNPEYGRSKLAAILYSKYLAKHVTSKYPNILVNATHPGVVDTRQSTQHIHDAFPVAGYGVSHVLNPLKKDQFEGAVSAMFAATKTEGSGQYICPPAIVEKGSGLANDEQLMEKLMETTWKVVREKTERESAGKGCPFRES